VCDYFKLNLGSFCHLTMNDWAAVHGERPALRSTAPAWSAPERRPGSTSSNPGDQLDLIRDAIANGLQTFDECGNPERSNRLELNTDTKI
jgi:hypothetical protein